MDTRSQLLIPQSANQAAPTVQSSQHAMPPTVQDKSISLNWILFDESRPRVEPYKISIPRNLFRGPSYDCRPLFIQPLREMCKVTTVAEGIKFWKPKGSLSVQEEGKWKASMDPFEDQFTKIPYPASFSRKLVVDDGELVHLVITIDHKEAADVDKTPVTKEYQRYMRTLGKGTSVAVSTNGYCVIQADEDQAIRDGRRAPDGRVLTIGPPVHIFHPIFDEFAHLVDDPRVQPTISDLTNVQELMRFASCFARLEYQDGMRYYLNRILRDEDGSLVLRKGGVRIEFMLIELKREVGDGDCDPTLQAGINMKSSWLDPSRREIRQKSCCPTFLVTGGGPWIGVLGGVFTDKLIVQRLTDLRWMAMSSSMEDSRVYHNARLFVALRRCLVKLRNFYRGLDEVPPLLPNLSHSLFPYPTSFTAEDGRLISFRYLSSLKDDSTCVTFLAEIPDEACATGDEPAKVVVKFPANYGKEVHEFLAREGYAPALRYYGPLPGTKSSGVLPGPAEHAPPNLYLGSDIMHMVVMDYVDTQSHPPPDAREQIATLLIKLHSEGYVFGNLREQNILFDIHGKIKLIDCKWGGQYDMDIRDDGLPSEVQERIDENKHRVRVGDGRTYVCYRLSMPRVDGKWVPGMAPFDPIRPQHDWAMLDKLSW